MNEQLDYLVREKGDGRRPTILELCYTTFIIAKNSNNEDGTDSDWFNDVRPVIMAALERIRDEKAIELV